MSIIIQSDRTAPRRPNALDLRRVGVTLAKAVLGWPLRVHANRKLLAQMAGMSACELADIGLTPADLRDTAALPLDMEVGHFLSCRVSSRRTARDRRM